MVGSHQVDEVARFEDGEPAPRRVVADAAVAPQRAEIQHLSRAPRAQLDEPLKLRQVVHIGQGADIPFQVGADVKRQRLCRVQLAVMDAYKLSNKNTNCMGISKLRSRGCRQRRSGPKPAGVK